MQAEVQKKLRELEEEVGVCDALGFFRAAVCSMKEARVAAVVCREAFRVCGVLCCCCCCVVVAAGGIRSQEGLRGHRAAVRFSVLQSSFFLASPSPEHVVFRRAFLHHLGSNTLLPRANLLTIAVHEIQIFQTGQFCRVRVSPAGH